MTTKNPWLGLASYEEPKNDGNDYQFCGRDEETLDLVRLIDNNLFITLYGSSGIGKTSLLRAGVIPILRRKDYFPLYVRLSQEPTEISYAEAIVRKLQGSGLTEEKGAATRHPDGNDRLYLWNYFATTRFMKDGREVYPVIILDQFEEVFREGDKAKAELLLRQIYCLLNDELEMPDEEGYSADTNYRFVASIREDFLFVLEDSIDENSLDLYKDNRYRLRPMKPEQARQVVLVPGKDCIEEWEKDAIAERVISLAKRPQSEDIDTLLLSIVCSGTYDKKFGEKIASSDLAVWKNNPMEVYYQDAVKGLSAKQIRYIQQHLIREDGSRRRVDAEKLKVALGELTYRQLTQGVNRLFALGDKGQVELLHDQLGMAVYEERKAFEERERKKKLKRRIWLIVSMTFFVLLFFLIMLYIIGEQQHELEAKQWRMMENQARYTAEKANSLVDEGNSYLAQRLLMEVMPPYHPYTTETEFALRNAVYHNSAILRGHTWSVNSVAFNSDGRRIVSGSGDHSVIIWDAEDGSMLGSFALKTRDGKSTWVKSASLSPDDETLASIADDSIIYLWKLDLGLHDKDVGLICDRELIGHMGEVNSVHFSPDGTKIVSTSEDGTVKEWNTKTGEDRVVFQYKKTINEYEYPTEAIFSPDGSRIIVASLFDNAIYVLDAGTGNIIKSWQGYHGTCSLDISPDGKRIVVASAGGQRICVWDIETGERTEYPSYGNDVIVAFSPNGNLIVSGARWGEDRNIRIWRVGEVGPLYILEGHTDDIAAVSFSPDGKRIVSTSADKTIRLWDCDAIGCVFEENEDTICGYPYSPDGNYYVSDAFYCDPYDSIWYYVPDWAGFTIWNAKTHKVVKTYLDCADYVFTSFSPDGKLVAFPSSDATINVCDVETGTIVNTFKEHTSELWHRIRTINFSPNGKLIASASCDYIRVWDVKTGKEITCIERVDNKMYINCAAVNPDSIGMRIVSASADGFVRVWDAETGELLGKKAHDDDVNVAFFSPDGTKIVSASDDKTVRIWDVECETELLKLEGHTKEVRFASFSPDGNYIVSIDDDGFIFVWDAYTGDRLQVIADYARFAFFSSDGKHIVTDNHIWSFPPLQDLIDQTRERFKDHPLTPEERRKYYLE